jgi:hypothetical protein
VQVRKPSSISYISALVIFRRADQADGQRAERVGNRRPLRNGGHRHQQRHRNARRRARDHRDDDQIVIDHLMLDQRADDRDDHADLTRAHAASGGRGMAHPHQRQYEQDRRQDRRKGYECVHLTSPAA